MNNETKKILIEKMIRKAFEDIDDSPKRVVRNLVDMARHFSNGRFQQNFFAVIQTMLEDQTSSYYPFFQDIVTHVDLDHLLKFGMNIGYNSCTVGAKIIRTIEKTDNYNIPWSIIMHIDEENLKDNFEIYKHRLSEGELIGIYTWQIFYDGNLSFLLDITEKYPNSSFFIICREKELNDIPLEELIHHKNIMIVLHYEEDLSSICKQLRDNKLPYSIFYEYQIANLPDIKSGTIFYELENLHPIFTILQGDSSIPKNIKQNIYKSIKEIRDTQRFQIIPWEMTLDTNYIDSIISNNPCSVFFDKNGFIHTASVHNELLGNLFEDSFKTLFKTALHK